MSIRERIASWLLILCLALASLPAWAGTAALLPNGEQTFVDANGAPIAGGSVYFYIPNTSTFKNTWSDPGETQLNTNPVVLDSAGRAIIYGSGQYRQVVKDQYGNTLWDQLTQDPISAVTGTLGAAAFENLGNDIIDDGAGNLTIAASGVTSGTYSNPTITINSEGRITTASTQAVVLRGYIDGLVLSTAGSSATFSVAAGEAADSTNTAMMTLAAAISKTTSAWSAGTGNGCLDTGSIATATWYGVFEIENPTTSTVDVLCTKETAGSAPSPTMPSGYTLKRYIGSMSTNGSSQWAAFVQNGGDFRWVVPPLDGNGISLTTAYANITLSVPLGVKVRAEGRATGGSGSGFIATRPTTGSDGTPSGTVAPLAILNGGALAYAPAGVWSVWTNTSGQIQWAASGSETAYLVTTGWFDLRGTNG